MKLLSAIVFLFLTIFSYSQETKENYTKTIEDLITKYNEANYNDIYLSMFSENYRNNISNDDFEKTFKQIKWILGQINNKEFIEYSKGMEGEITLLPEIKLSFSKSSFPYVNYRFQFEREKYNFNVSIDNDNKINEFSIFPFAENYSTNSVNNIQVSENIIDEKQQKIIFNKAKFFPDNTQISMAFIKNGKVKYYGVKRKNDTISEYINSKAVYEIGSISKVFTSNILANFVIANKLKLEDNINGYINLDINPDEDGSKKNITFKSLSNHTSGLPREPENLLEKGGFSIKKLNPYKKEDFESYLSESLKLNYEMIGEFSYSNLGVSLLGYIFTEMENLSYESLYDKYIFSKYQLNNTTFKAEKVKDLFVEGLNIQGDKIPFFDRLVSGPAGGILSNTEDLAKYALLQFDGSDEELKLMREKTFKINSKRSIGLGWFIINPKSNKKRMYQHSGNTNGYSAFMMVDLENKDAVILLSNVSYRNQHVQKINRLGYKLMRSLK